ncbi:glycosyl hydrolase [Paenibacillus radicis (ex Xue et al. 2023)]|uniref:Glycosyl hydrolase n=1 Tax=Paenibacillus radicis (ex Xue et al. 2023) TaxID=2972489 RepID=A0ABT1YR85_9BACL|nr:glycosyl hydrolase [Paenibacillus radicis (ex Xue et al. 2023)]MCR8635696.1 glycosyl hydrolase [Paenibacillus radicis (ex Xue et al. 2023)]
MELLSQLKKQFEQPSAEYRSVPFWAWNDELKQEELIRQIEDMKEQGIGGFFMHSRDGLETPYLGKEWMDSVHQSVAKAEELGMKAWLYDEDRWPSGSAGGGVPAQGDEFRSKGLTLEVVSGEDSTYEDDGRVVAIFKASIQGMDLIGCEKLPLIPWVPSFTTSPASASTLTNDSDMPASASGTITTARAAQNLEFSEGEVLLVFRVEVSAPSEWFNDEAPPDSMNSDTVRRFIDSTYEVYKAEVGDQFGRTITGIFTDEPGVHDRHCQYTAGRGWVPWTYSFTQYFKELRGYDILDVLPYLYFNGERSPMARHDYWRTVSDKFCESYTKQLGDWCETNGLAFTGHYLWESALGVATRVCGAIMPHYRYQHVPGIDMLCEQTDEHMTIKQCTSVANQYGRKFVISETYGCTGWEFTFEGQKWMGDWQYVLGVNLRSQHLALYSMKGCRKRDYPPVFNYQTSWWKYNRIIEDYFARIGAVITEGNPVRDILVLHPVSTAWSMLGTNPYGSPRRGLDRDIPGIDRYGYEFNELLRVLLGAHYDFDLGDETIMAEVGEVREQEKKLYVNLAGYKTLIIPPIRTMLHSTFELLMDFLNAGGQAIAMTPAPTMIEGRLSEDPRRLYNHAGVTMVSRPEELIAKLEQLQPRAVSIRNRYGAETPELLYLLKETGDGHTLFIVNNDRQQAFDVCIDTQANGRVEEWDALTGNIKQVQSWMEDGRLRFYSRFGPTDSKLYVIYREETSSPVNQAKLAPPALLSDADLYAAIGPVFQFSRTMPNVLTLDTCSYRMRDAGWSESKEIWVAQREIRDALGMRQVYYNGITQRYKWIRDAHPNDGTPVSLKLSFHVTDVPVTEVSLVVEGAQQFQLNLNGQPLSNTPHGWFVDRSMDQVRLPGIRQGVNELELSCSYNQAMEIEDCYLIGDFGVSISRSIMNEPETLRTGDWGLQGYFHYNGSIIYHADYRHQQEEGNKAILMLGDYSAVTVEIRANGVTAGHVPWKAANGVDLTPYLINGINKLEIEVMGSPRNMFGPFHGARGRTATTDWSSFRQEGKLFTPDYVVEPYGLMGQVKIIRSKEV